MSSDWICGVCFDINFARNKTCRWGCDTINPTLPEDEVNALEAGIGLDDGGAGGGGAQASPGGGPQDAGGGNFGNNFGGGGGHQHGGGGGQQGGEKPRGRGGPTVIPGDWICPGCGDLQFARNYSCRICSTPKPPNAGMEDLSKGKGKSKGGKDKGGKGGKDKGGYGGGKGGYGGGKQDNGFGGGGYGGGKQDNGFGGGGYGGGKQDNGFGGGYGGGKQDNGFGGGKDFYGGGKQDNNNFGGQQQQQQFGGPQDNNNFGGQQQQQPDPFAGMIGELPQPGVGDMPKPDMGVFAGGDAQAGGAPSMDPGSFSRNLLATIITTGQDNSPDWKTLWQDFCTLQNSTNQNPNKHSEVFLRQFLASNVHTFAEETWLQESKDVLMSMGINLDSGEVRLTPDQPENPAVEEFIRDNGFDDNASESLRGLSAEEQQAIMGRGGVKDFPNPSAVLLMRIKELADSRAGGGKGANKENVWGGNGGAPGGNNMFGKGGAQKMQGQAGANRFAPY